VLNLYAVVSAQGMWWMKFISHWSGAGTAGPSLKGENNRSGASHAMDIVSLLQVPSIVRRPDKFELWLSPESLNKASELLSAVNKAPIVIFLGGERHTRHESPERAEVWLSEIQRRWAVHPVIVGTTHDPGLLKRTTVDHTDLRGRCNIEETAAVISKARALITTHSAPQHFASVTQIPTVVLVGPGDAERYRPSLPEERMQLLRNPVPCSPCYFTECPWTGDEYKRCLTGITPESIVQAFERVFSVTYLNQP